MYVDFLRKERVSTSSLMISFKGDGSFLFDYPSELPIPERRQRLTNNPSSQELLPLKNSFRGTETPNSTLHDFNSPQSGSSKFAFDVKNVSNARIRVLAF